MSNIKRKKTHIVIHDTKGKTFKEVLHYHLNCGYKGELITDERAEALREAGIGYKRPYPALGYHYYYHPQITNFINYRNIFAQYGAHCPFPKGENSMNKISIGICIEGDFSINEPSEIIYIATSYLIYNLMKILNIKKENVLFHKEVFEKANCPGGLFNKETLFEKLNKLLRYK